MIEYSLIVAVNQKDNYLGIGNEGKIPWYIPEDLAFFKKMTLGSTVVMGRKTYESIGKKLPDRRNVILSKTTKGEDFYDNLDKVIFNTEKVFFIGGRKIYEDYLPFCKYIFITYVYGEYECDTFFPPIPEYFIKIFSSPVKYSKKDNINYVFTTWINKNPLEFKQDNLEKKQYD